MPEKEREHYEITVNDLGANVLRRGCCTAASAPERLGERGELLFRHLADVGAPSLEDATAHDLARCVGDEPDADADMLVTRAMLQGGMWLKRAVQVMFKEEQSSLHAQWLTMEGRATDDHHDIRPASNCGS